jgi:glucose-1-phosphate cytidylyltransferase
VSTLLRCSSGKRSVNAQIFFMKTVILAGGLGTRLAEETSVRPKPMVEVGGKPLLWHIMNIFAAHGHRDFLIAAGYKGEVIKEYFRNYFFHNSDLVVDLASGKSTVVNSDSPNWKVGIYDTGLNTLTGGRARRLKRYLDDGTFLLTYGDGLGDVDITRLVEFHRSHGAAATVTIVRPPARFGSVILDGDLVTEFSEKAPTREGWINGGFFVFEPKVLDYIGSDEDSLEAVVLERLVSDHQLRAFRHEGFWQPVDTLREKMTLESLWQSGNAPWRIWA